MKNNFVKLYKIPKYKTEIFIIYFIKLSKLMKEDDNSISYKNTYIKLDISERTWFRFIKESVELGICRVLDDILYLNPIYTTKTSKVSIELFHIFKDDINFRKNLNNTQKALYGIYCQDLELSKITSLNKGIKICNTHGEFIEDYDLAGCPYCSMEMINLYKYPPRYFDKPTIFYCIQIDDIFKIGITSKSVYDRYKYERVEYNIVFEYTFNTGSTAFHLEQECLKVFDKDRYKNSDTLFRYTGNSEVFTRNIIKSDLFMEIFSKYKE